MSKNSNNQLLNKIHQLQQNYPSIFYLTKWICITLCIGICIGSASAGFLISLEWVTEYRENHLWLVSLLPIAGLLVGLLYHYYGKNVEAGNNLIIDSIHGNDQKIPFKMAPFVYVGTLITHLFGGSAGREGTALQMAGAIADQFTKLFRLTKDDRKVLLISAVAAGFGSVFGTPIAGAIFGLEFYLIGKLRYNALFPAFLAAIFADVVTKFWNATHTHYHIDFVPEINIEKVLWAILAGILFGICAASFSKMMTFLSNLFKKYIHFPPLRPFVGGIIVAILVFIVGTSRYIGLGIPTILESFNHQLPWYDFALKLALTVITLSCGFKGGEVTPLFFIGATLGSALSFFVPLPTALLAGMGFVAVFAGATNTPLACTVMAIELFGIECGVFVAIACIVSYFVSGNNSIYKKQIIGEPKHQRFNHYKNKNLTEL